MRKINPRNLKKRKLLVLFFLFSVCCIGNIKPTTFNDQDEIIQLNSNLFIFEDYSSNLKVDEVLLKDSFILSSQKVPNFGISSSTYWIKFSVKNDSKVDQLILGLTYPLMDHLELYEIQKGKGIKLSTLGDEIPFNERKYKHQNFLFDLGIDQLETKHYALKIRSWEQISVPLIIGKTQSIYEQNLTQDLIFGLFFGIMIVLVFYNLFIYFTVKDNSYLYYVVYILFISLTQATLFGYTFRLFLSDFPGFTNISLVVFNSLAGIATIEFIKLFLKTKKHTPLLHKGFYILTLIYVCGIATGISGLKTISYTLMDIGGMLISFYTLYIAIKISLKGYRPAKIFLFAWTIFLLGVIFFVLKSVGVLPSNTYTNYTMTFGISLEGIILSIALADRINIYKKDKEEAQQKTLDTLKENEKIIREQNVILEQKVTERTSDLNQALTDLKLAQVKLIDAEKMSSLGQLTAGIAHEINNPINFVSSNIPPLRQDLEELTSIINKYEEISIETDISIKLDEINRFKEELDYEYLKTELNTIVNGIADGAKRTTEIVSGLKNFSRLDEVDLQSTNINEGVNSSLILIKNKLQGIKLTINLANLPSIDCYPGKLNQLFMNIIDNAIYAVKAKTDETIKEITVETLVDDCFIKISVKDSGVGMSEETKSKIFEPFYTTKPVGDGTGLGMSISYSVIKLHNAIVEINSEENQGTEIIIKIPINGKN